MTPEPRAPDRLAWLCFWTLKISNGLFGALFFLAAIILITDTVSTAYSGEELIGVGVGLAILASYACLFLAHMIFKLDRWHHLLIRANGIVVTVATIMLLFVIFASDRMTNDIWWISMLFLWPGLNLIGLKIIRRRTASQVHKTFE